MPINTNVLDNQWRWRPSASGSGCRTKYFPEAGSSNFRYGEPVILSGESVAQAITLPGSNSSVSSNLADTTILLGWALANSTGTTGTPIPVLLAKDVEVLVRVYNATASSAELQDVAVGDLAAIKRYRGTSATDVFAVITDAPSGTAAENKVVIVEKYSPNQAATNAALPGEQAATDTFGLVWCRLRDVYTVQGQ